MCFKIEKNLDKIRHYQHLFSLIHKKKKKYNYLLTHWKFNINKKFENLCFDFIIEF